MICKDCNHYEACGGYLPTDLDKDIWEYCTSGKVDEIPDIENRCSSFRPSVQLPSPNSETYINLETLNNLLEMLYKEPESWHQGETYFAGISSVMTEIGSLPTVEIRQGKWIKAECSESDGDAHCSICDSWDWSDKKYCSNCGAKMAVKEEN